MPRSRRCSCLIMVGGILQINLWSIACHTRVDDKVTLQNTAETASKSTTEPCSSHPSDSGVSLITDCIDRPVMAVKPVCIVAKLAKSARTGVQESCAQSFHEPRLPRYLRQAR
jgi:hypothetical protein